MAQECVLHVSHAPGIVMGWAFPFPNTTFATLRGASKLQPYGEADLNTQSHIRFWTGGIALQWHTHKLTSVWCQLGGPFLPPAALSFFVA